MRVFMFIWVTECSRWLPGSRAIGLIRSPRSYIAGCPKHYADGNRVTEDNPAAGQLHFFPQGGRQARVGESESIR